MKKIYSAYRCWNCGHISRILKKRIKYRCSKCKTRETRRKPFKKWSWIDISICMDYYAQESRKTEEVKLDLKYRNIMDIPSDLLWKYLFRRRYWEIYSKKNIKWIQEQGNYSREEAQKTIEIIHKYFEEEIAEYRSDREIPEPIEPIWESKPPEPIYQYCMWTNRGCINPEKKLSEDGFKCIKNKLKDDCLLLSDE